MADHGRCRFHILGGGVSSDIEDLIEPDFRGTSNGLVAINLNAHFRRAVPTDSVVSSHGGTVALSTVGDTEGVPGIPGTPFRLFAANSTQSRFDRPAILAATRAGCGPTTSTCISAAARRYRRHNSLLVNGWDRAPDPVISHPKIRRFWYTPVHSTAAPPGGRIHQTHINNEVTSCLPAR
jgi:hypothetical protein